MTAPIASLAPAAPRPAVRPAAPLPAARPAMRGDAFRRTAPVAALAPVAPAAGAAPLPAPSQVTGNGFGFVVYDPKAGGVTKFFTHPYRFMKANPKAPKGEGIETPNVLKHLAWLPKTGVGPARYQAESQVITAGNAAGTQAFMMPFGLRHSALVTTLAPGDAGQTPTLALDWANQVERKRPLSIDGKPAWVVKLAGVKEPLVLVPLGGGQPQVGATLTGAPGWAIVSVPDEAAVEGAVRDVRRWQGATPAGDLAQREAQALEAWRVAPPAGLSEAERRLWRQSETVMRMGQIQEPNVPGRTSSGMILASLPDGEWFIPWVRDMSYAAVALARMGHGEEARRALDAMLHAQGVGKMREPGDKPYQISTVRYFGDGTEEADYSGKPRPNVEYDSWGLALWAMGEYVRASGDVAWLKQPTPRGTTYGEIRDFVVAPLLDKLVPHGDGLIVTADTGPWEQNDQPRRHYAYATIAAIKGLREFLPLAEACGDAAQVALVREKLARLGQGFQAAFVKDGELRGTLEPGERNAMDGALLEAINMGVVTDPAVIRSTIDRMAKLAAPGGGYLRVQGKTGYERQEFVFIDFALARVLRRVGRDAEAAAIEQRLVGKANQQQALIPEMYVSNRDDEFDGPLGAPTGATPMVGYGAGIYVIDMLERSAAALR